ncbi:hypothetical protein BV20DRAFT_977209 [Pilatotrama ljubarskyi]|nr:hypothetical protein BV20DRAFT_977209 [Pilatotrama ljubarskyi]
MRSSSAREASTKPRPLLVLKLSSSSFLDTIIRDDKTKDPIYINETTRDLTNIYRLDHPRDEPVKAATVQWPLHPVRIKGKSGRQVQFGNGSWREAEDLLKSGPLGSTAIRKFSIPHYPNSLKWKLIPGNCFCCVTSAVKGPVAVLDAATLSAPPRLKVYHPLIERDVARSQDNYKGVPTVLLDYLVVTSFLLVTDVQEWLDRPREARIPGSSSYTIQRWLALIHHTPAPPEPDHPTVDLSLTVPSTPPQSATFPSPGGYWETQSGVTTLSGTGSNGSGSGASYGGEPFTPTTPVTSATSANSSTFFSSRSGEEAPPPVPPVPVSGSSSSAGAGNAEPARVRERPKSNPQAITHSSHSSTSTANGTAAASQSHAQKPDGGVGASTMQRRSRSAHTLSISGGALGAPSTSAPTSPLPMSASSSSSSCSRLARRQLPVPPGPVPANSFAQPWLYSSSPPSASSSAMPTPTPATTSSPSPAPATASASASASASSPAPVAPSTPPSSSASALASAARAARASMRGSLRTIPIPPPPPPPQHSIPLPPKLAQEQQRAAGYAATSRPRTAPELDSAGGTRRRHSESFSGTQPYGAGVSPEDEDGMTGTGMGMHPYASAEAATSFSLRGRGEYGAVDREVHDLAGQMRGLAMSPGPGPSSLPHAHPQSRHSHYHNHSGHSGHIRAPSQPAPDYDAHSFVNMPPPPLPVPPSSSSGTGSRPLPRRQLTVVNADLPPSEPDAELPIGSPPLASSVSGACSSTPPPPLSSSAATVGDLSLRLDPRMSYADSVYEMPPPAYDAIDFSVQFVPAVPPIPAQFAVVHATGAPLPAETDGQPRS